MKVTAANLSFSYGEKSVFHDLSFVFNTECSPVVILGSSGCGKTTLIKLIAALIQPEKGKIQIESGTAGGDTSAPSVSCVFQEPCLLLHMSVLENTALPIRKIYGRETSLNIAREALASVQLADKSEARPDELSGGQKQRAALARAFAYPSEIIMMDEPFQSLDIPLKLDLMDLTASLLAEKKRLAVIISHDPREAVYLGKRVLVLGKPPEGIIFDEEITLSNEERAYGSAAAAKFEKKIIDVLKR